MKTTTIPTHELTGLALDWAVAQAHNLDAAISRIHPDGSRSIVICYEDDGDGIDGRCYSPSAHDGDGHPIIEREGISLRPIRKPGHSLDGQWLAHIDHGNTGNLVQWVEFLFKDQNKRRYWKGDTALQAAMRCYVASKLGPSIDVPQELQP